MRVRFWGVRGSCPAPGAETARYGGNTSCVEVRLADGQLLIMDSGTGLRTLGSRLLAEAQGKPIEATILLSHFHWDHIQGFPFFVPAYGPRNRFRIFGASMGNTTERLFSGQMEGAYFPVPLQAMGADLSFHDLKGDPVEQGRVKISYIVVNHPGLSIAYKLQVGQTSVVYISDHEFRQDHPLGEPVEGPLDVTTVDPRLHEFISGVDLLICEGQYDREEYRNRVGWGHSIWEDTLRAAAAARPKRICLYHHDPEHSDQWVDAQVHGGRKLLADVGSESLPLEAAYEGMTIELPE